jgi:hypothetical protein
MDRSTVYNEAPRVIVARLSNTILTTSEYVTRTRRAMAHRLAQKTGLDEAVIRSGMKAFYNEYGLSDYRLVQGLRNNGTLDISDNEASMLIPETREVWSLNS